MSADALFAELKSSMEWNDSSMSTLKHVWKEEGPSLIAVPTMSLSIGQVRKGVVSAGVVETTGGRGLEGYVLKPSVCVVGMGRGRGGRCVV